MHTRLNLSLPRAEAEAEPLARTATLQRCLTATLMLIGLLLAIPAWSAAPLPGRVGRLVEAPAGVWLQDRDSQRWMASAEQSLVNWPLTSGDRLRTDGQARAELRIGSVSVRLDGRSELFIQRLDDQRVVLRLEQGSAALQVGDSPWIGQIELQTREGRWLPQRVGHYRFDRESDATQASVWRGELRFESSDSTLLIGDGRRADLWLPAGGGPTNFAWAQIQNDAFSDWVVRDQRADAPARSAIHVPAEMTGWQDLDRYGDWQDHPEHGGVWLPRRVPSGWEPYRDGRWAWVSPWGWTWIDAAPWGFAPFHYGLWLQIGGRWAWSPGPRHHRPVFAPVLGGWVSKPGVHIGVNIGQRPPPPVVVVPRFPPGHGQHGQWQQGPQGPAANQGPVPGREPGQGRGRGRERDWDRDPGRDHDRGRQRSESQAPPVMAQPMPPKHDDPSSGEVPQPVQRRQPGNDASPSRPEAGRGGANEPRPGRGPERARPDPGEAERPTMALPRRPLSPQRAAEASPPSAAVGPVTPVAAPQPTAAAQEPAPASRGGPRGRQDRAEPGEARTAQERSERVDRPERAERSRSDERREAIDAGDGGRGGREPRQQR